MLFFLYAQECMKFVLIVFLGYFFFWGGGEGSCNKSFGYCG